MANGCRDVGMIGIMSFNITVEITLLLHYTCFDEWEMQFSSRTHCQIRKFTERWIKIEESNKCTLTPAKLHLALQKNFLAGVVYFSKKEPTKLCFPLFLPCPPLIIRLTIPGSLSLKGERKQTVVLQLSEARADLLSVGWKERKNTLIAAIGLPAKVWKHLVWRMNPK